MINIKIEDDILKWLSKIINEKKTFLYSNMFDFEAEEKIFSKTDIILNSRPENYNTSLPDPNNVEIIFDQENESIKVDMYCVMRIPPRPMSFVFSKASEYYCDILLIYQQLVKEQELYFENFGYK